MNVQLSPKTLAVVLAGVIAVLGAGGWFGLVASQRSTSSSLDAKVQETQATLDALSATAQEPGTTTGKGAGKAAAKARADQAALLARAFPRSVEMPSILLQVQKLATQSGVTLEAFAPSLGIPLAGYQSIAIDVTVSGRYREIQRFVHALRTQAGSSRGRVHASGRLFAVETVGITAAADGLPALNATVALDAFVYSGVPTGSNGETVADDATGSADSTSTAEGTG